jgi:signal transduction histidine kinase
VQEAALVELLEGGIEELAAALHELRDLARGIHPEVLSRRGLAAALRVTTARMPLPVDLDVPPDRYDERAEVAAYYVASEALANVVKYARATKAEVRVWSQDERLIVEVADDGVGGADESAGTGLRGLADRITALDGTFSVDSAARAGTRVRAEIPLG